VYELNNYDFLVTFSAGQVHKLAIDPGASEVRLGRDPLSGEVITRQVYIKTIQS